MKRLALAAAILFASAPARADDLLDVGARFGYARPLGAWDAGTRATDLSFGGAPLALDGTVRLGPRGPWRIGGGLFASWAETIPTLCASTPDCISSIGRDAELGLLARVRAPRLGFLLPEAEIGTGWSWSTRKLVDQGTTSRRTWSGPTFLRAALVPSVALSSRLRLGVVVGGSLGRATSFHLAAPGLDARDASGAKVHGTFDVGVRLGADLF